MPDDALTELPFHVHSADEIEPTRLEWLWPGYLPRGKLALIEGDPGLGKSWVTLDLCARLSRGAPWPDGSPSPGPSPSLIVNGEDGAADTLRPRLERLGADLSQVFLIRPRSPDGTAALQLPLDINELDTAVYLIGARLLVLDPVAAFLDTRAVFGSDRAVRSASAPLAALATNLDCAVVMVRHLTKGRGRAITRGQGSIGFGAACRSVWLIAAEPAGRRTSRVFVPVKHNLATPPTALSFEATPHPEAGITWHGPSPWTAEALAADRPEKPGAPERAVCFLKNLLRDGPMRVSEVQSLAEAAEIGERTLGRARVVLDVRSERTREGGRQVSYWMREGQELPGGDRS